MTGQRKKGFTIIELMVALVVGGLLMAAMVALSGSVQRSFGFSKNISELQTNLRFTMKTLVDDLSRAAFMASPDAHRDGHIASDKGFQKPADPQPAIWFADQTITLLGNYTSARAYNLAAATAVVHCLDKSAYDPVGGCALSTDRYNEPFYDGPKRLDDIFCSGVPVRLDPGDRYYIYYQVDSVSADTLTVNLNPAVDQDIVNGDFHMINPINTVSYQIVVDDRYKPRYQNPTANATRWILQRTYTGCDQGQLAVGEPIEIGAFLLDPQGPRPGWEFEIYQDVAPELSLETPNPDWQPNVVGPTPLDWGNSPPPERLRALIVTLRARTEFEDPNFFIPNYTPDQDIGVDLDGNPQNGLAHVRTERTVVLLPNLGLNLSL